MTTQPTTSQPTTTQPTTSQPTAAPLPPRVSGGAPLVGHALEFVRDPEAVMRRGYDEHGLVYSMKLANKDAVVLLGHEHSMFLFTETDKRLSLREAYPFVRRLFDPEFYFFASYDEYRRQRNLVAPRFQGRQLNTYLAIMSDETRELERKLGDEGEFELNSTFGPFVMGVAARTLLGEEFAKTLSVDDYLLLRVFAKSVRHTVLPSWVPTPRNVRSKLARRKVDRMIAETLRQRRERPLDPPDFLQLLSESVYDDGTPVPDRVKANLILLLVWAGHETTTGHLAWALIDLLRHPEQFAAVRAEQDAVLGVAVVPTPQHVREMTLLDDALHESERLHPVVPVMLRIASEDIDYAGYRIPKGAYVLNSPAVTHRLPESFEDPDEFRPGRYDGNRSKTSLIGFGGGVHRCLGTHFAYTEMTIALGSLVRRFDFELVDPDPQPVPGALTKWPRPTVVRYRRR